MSDNNSANILFDLKKNFVSQRQDILLTIQGIETNIAHNKDIIVNLNNKEDTDLGLFSPRSSAKLYDGQIREKEKEIEALEDELRIQYKKLSNVTKQLDSLKEVRVQKIEDEDQTSVKKEEVEAVDPVPEDNSELIANLNMLVKKINDIESNEISAGRLLSNDPVRAQQILASNSRILEECRADILELIKQL